MRACCHDVQANQWLVARSGGLEAIAGALRCWRDYPMVQLCALLCMVPLALDNNVLQVRRPPLCFSPNSSRHWCGIESSPFFTQPR